MKIFQMTVSVLIIFVLFCGHFVLAQDRLSPASVRDDLQEDGFPCALSGGCEEDIISADPTFIQNPTEGRAVRTSSPLSQEVNGLVGEILIPGHAALVRANVPIFGRAYGENFKEYRVEYGQGEDPTDWTVIETSTIPQTQHISPKQLYLSADLSIEGNLATWDTGLKNYVYLPTHPKDHPINFKGTYTVRLVVSSLDGQTVEDRVLLHVANVIPNAWGGRVVSPDEHVKLFVPEQAMTAPFRLILIQSAVHAPSTTAEDRQPIGKVYEVKEPSERFTKDVILEMKIPKVRKSGGMTRMAIYGYDNTMNEWIHLPTFQRASGGGRLQTRVKKLHAFYVVMLTNRVGEGAHTILVESSGSPLLKVNNVQNPGHYLVKENFENGMGQWSNRDGEVGATVSLDESSTFDGTQALKIVNNNFGGNFAVNVSTTPFDVREFPVIEFDYRMEPEVKTNFFAKVSGRWYMVGLTDDPMELKRKRVNIADIGSVHGILADDKWHTAQLNLYDMLRTKTGNVIVEELIMADWDVPGYMKLQFGHNPSGATYYIDNFMISRELETGLRTSDATIVVDTFNQKKERNHLGGPFSGFQSSSGDDGGNIRIDFDPDDASGRGHSLALSYDVSRPKSFSGYVTTFPNLDLRGFHALSFSTKSLEKSQDLFIGLRDSLGNEQKILLSTYLSRTLKTHWETVMIPLTIFGSELHLKKIEHLSFSFAHDRQSEGKILLDDIQFHRHVQTFHVDNFEEWHGKNLLGGQHRTFAKGVAAVNGSYTRGSPNGLYRLSYGGNIGTINAYASDLLTYAGWETHLGGIDCSRCTQVTFRIRGGQGGEKPNIYLDDGNFRWSVDLEHYQEVTTEWQWVTIPLKDFADYGVDLTHLEEFQVVFEWEQMSSTLYLDDVWFGEKTKTKS
ncbi:hypothetical protein [Candidatus Nitrospira salsa]